MKEKEILKESYIGLELCKNGKLNEGIVHLRIAAEHNNLKAIVNLGHALELKEEYDEAFKWTNIGANLNDPTALFNLSLMYRNGKATLCDVSKAVKCGEKLIKNGFIDDGYNSIVSAYLYAKDIYQQDFTKGYEYALKGSKIIMMEEPKRGVKCDTVTQLALCYDFGKGIIEDKIEALKYYKYGMACDNAICYYNGGCILAYSKDEKICDVESAINYLKKAGDLGYTDGYFEIGCLFHDGKEVKKDLEIAQHYYSLAIRFGNGERYYQDAVNNLSKISEEIARRMASGKYCPTID